MFEGYDELLQEISTKLIEFLDEEFIEINLNVERPSKHSILYYPKKSRQLFLKSNSHLHLLLYAPISTNLS